MVEKYKELEESLTTQLRWSEQDRELKKNLIITLFDTITEYEKKYSDVQIELFKVKKKSRVKTYIIAGLVGTIGIYIATK